ncbi:uncharacterized protein C8Q71DRAFT_851962 [Rhodofomes roseus]|uniref:Uncharacterized protein n=1 Tax=Rhodofomes roseus TaxID=34475 RepID=A0ABQ8JXA7_9APHY|nr:uncharacterized protein C8Q71DRAFT_851962 [Rhodofomes roseus]KAH9828708.1 hypothetical protein C8Q71DRAFT_851962 [Rhodofomes roseus]
MRFSNFLPLAIVAAASVAVARPVDDYMFAARSNSEVALSERDLQIISHFAREYLAARSDADLYLSARSDFEDGDLFEREYLEPGLVARGPLDQPQREHYRTFDEYEKAFLEWNARMRKMDHAGKKILNKNEAAYNKHQGGSSKSGGLSKLFGKKKA